MQKSIRQKLFSALLLTVCFGTVHAATPTPESVQRYMVVTKTEQLLDQTLKQPIDYSGFITEVEPDPIKRQALLGSTAEFQQYFEALIDRQQLMLLMQQSVASTFTQAEIDAAIAFYETDEGQSMLVKTPDFMHKVMQGLMPILGQAITDTLEKIKQQQTAE